MKRLLVALLVWTMFTMSLTAVSAAKQVHFAANGTLNSIDTTSGVLSLHVKNGSQPIKPFKGADVNIATNAATKFKLCFQATQNCTAIPLTDLKPGDRVTLNGVVTADKTFTAKRVTVVR